MPNRHRSGIEPVPNSAQLGEDGDVREARELWALGYSKHGWVCIDSNCRARMIPVAWERPNNEGRFCHPDGKPFDRAPYFRAEPGHKRGCKASYPIDLRNRASPEYDIGPPTDYPNRVILSPPRSSGDHVPTRIEFEQWEEDPPRQHARWVRSIREACEYYVSRPDQHFRPLRVDGCPGLTYAECFKRFGTGDLGSVGKNWIGYDEIRFRAWVEVDEEPIRLTLLGGIHQNPRTLVIHTAGSPAAHQIDFRKRLRAALMEARKAYREGRPERPWVFAFSRERAFDELEVEASLQPGIDVLTCAMPRLAWRYRPSHRFLVQFKQPPSSPPEPPSPDVEDPSVVAPHNDITPSLVSRDHESAEEAVEVPSQNPELTSVDGRAEAGLDGASNEVDVSPAPDPVAHSPSTENQTDADQLENDAPIGHVEQERPASRGFLRGIIDRLKAWRST